MKVNDKPITCQKGMSALEALEANGHRPKSECRNGFCGACRTKATGNPQYIKDPLGYTQHGEILICCVAAQSDINVEVSEPHNVIAQA